MKITPLDIRRREFKRSVRGYADEEVDIFLDEVADEFERLFQENMELQDKIHRLEEQSTGLIQMREALEKTLVTAQVQSEEMKANAHKESDLILRDAEFKARGIVSDSYSETQKVQRTLVQLKLLEEDFRFKFRSLLEGYMKLMGDASIAAQTVGAAALAGAAGEAPATEASAAPAEDAKASATRAPAAQAPPVPQATAAAQPPVAESAATETAPTVQPEAAAPTAPVALSSAESPAAATEELASLTSGPSRALEGTSPAALPDDDAPTLETQGVAARVSAAVEAYAAAESSRAEGVPADQEATFESPMPTRGDSGERPDVDSMSQGFFFGRQTDDFDDTFQTEDVSKTDRTREFQW